MKRLTLAFVLASGCGSSVGDYIRPAYLGTEEACSVLQAVWESSAADGRSGTSSGGEVANAALQTIDEAHATALQHCSCLCEGAMKRVLSSERTGADEADLFDALHRWVCADGARRGEASDRLVECLSYDLMPPSFLRDVVRPRCLVPDKTVNAAFEACALEQELRASGRSI